jgi:hypothetical protein
MAVKVILSKNRRYILKIIDYNNLRVTLSGDDD